MHCRPAGPDLPAAPEPTWTAAQGPRARPGPPNTLPPAAVVSAPPRPLERTRRGRLNRPKSLPRKGFFLLSGFDRVCQVGVSFRPFATPGAQAPGVLARAPLSQPPTWPPRPLFGPRDDRESVRTVSPVRVPVALRHRVLAGVGRRPLRELFRSRNRATSRTCEPIRCQATSRWYSRECSHDHTRRPPPESSPSPPRTNRRPRSGLSRIAISAAR